MNISNTILVFKQYQISTEKTIRCKGGGITTTDDLAKWRKNIEDGMIDRRSGTIK